MSVFTEKAREFIESGHYNVYHLTEIRDGVSETVSFGKSNPCQNSYSVAKAFVVTALGVLYDKGLLSTDEKVVDILRKYLPAGMDERWELTTVDMALKHKIGLPGSFLDIDVYSTYEFGKDFLSYMLSYPLEHTPGEESIYTDGAFYLLGRIVEEKAGMDLLKFMWKELFFDMEVQEAAWSTCPLGHPMGATGIYIRSSDMAKLGQLYLDRGEFKGKRLLSEDWTDIVLSRGYELKKTGVGLSYGKGGMRGQMLLVVPEKNSAIAWHACQSSDLKKEIINICYSC